MGAGLGHTPEPELYGYGGAMAGDGPSAGQVAFDLLFGVLTPVTLLVTDPALFVASVARRAALPPYWAPPVYVALGTLTALLLLWGVSGMNRPRLGLLLAGPFAAGALLSLALAAVLLPFAIVHSDLLSGWLALTPWLTAYVYIRHTVLAFRAGTERSGALALLIPLAAAAAIVAALGIVGVQRERRARQIESLLFSGSDADYRLGCSLIRRRSFVDWDRVATVYQDLPKDDPRLPRLREAFVRFTGEPMDSAIKRLSEYLPPPEPRKPTPEAPEEKGDEASRLLGLLFSNDLADYKEAADALLGLRPDQQTLDQIARRYAELDPDDPRRLRIDEAYRFLSGEPIDLAVKRVAKSKPPAKGKKAPKPLTSSPSAPSTKLP